MKSTIIQYAVIRFQPYTETGEFANIGVIAIDPKAGHFRFKIAERNSKRVTNFFKNINISFYSKTIAQIKRDLEARAKEVSYSKANAIDMFEDLIRPKSNLFQFEQPGALKAIDINDAVDKLYGDFVRQDFAKAKSYEDLLRKRVQDQLKELNLDSPFKPYDFSGPGGIKAKFDLVRVNDQSSRIIKPFAFNGKSANKLSDHTFNELKKLEIAHKSRELKSKMSILIPVDVIDETEDIREAWEYLKPMLRKYGDITHAENKVTIKEFALS
jgi:hypothetical protein